LFVYELIRRRCAAAPLYLSSTSLRLKQDIDCYDFNKPILIVPDTLNCSRSIEKIPWRVVQRLIRTRKTQKRQVEFFSAMDKNAELKVEEITSTSSVNSAKPQNESVIRVEDEAVGFISIADESQSKEVKNESSASQPDESATTSSNKNETPPIEPRVKNNDNTDNDLLSVKSSMPSSRMVRLGPLNLTDAEVDCE
jgi:hypothetical protein